jgi:Cof subfamily protein (haloacid dehalogenase superfamily)
MGKFDGILICSDWDGTLFDGEKVPKESVNAIKYFQENGGKFTLCSGRPPFYMNKMSDFVKPNTFALALNGTVLFDFDTGEIIQEKFVDEDIYRVATELISVGVKIKKLGIFIKGKNEYFWVTPEEFLSCTEELKKYPVYKVTIMTEIEEDGDILIAAADKIEKGIYSVLRSGRGYAEIILTDGSKGQAALYLKNHIGAKLLVCMGDYENDISMFECADVSYAPENAIPKIKSLATHVTVSVADAAVARVIEDIEKRYIK